MSKIADKIKRATRIESAPIGFGAIVATRKEPTLLVAINAPAGNAQLVSESVAQGADTVIIGPVEGKIDGKTLADAVKAAGEAACGLWLSGAAAYDDITQAKEAGADYVVVSVDAQAPALLQEGIGYVLAVSDDLPDTTLRALESMSFEGLLVKHTGGLTLRRHLELRRLAGLTRVPTFLQVDGDLPGKALESLREAGTIAIVVDGSGKDAPSRVAALRQAINDLPARRRRREDHMDASLPAVERAAAAVPDEDGEEDDD